MVDTARILASQVVGVTRGRRYPTVYFANGMRITQCHKHEHNVGQKTPGKNFYFGNVPYADIRSMKDEALSEIRKTGLPEDSEDFKRAKRKHFNENLYKYLEIDKDVEAGEPRAVASPPARNGTPEDSRLVEVKQGSGGPAVHISSAALEKVNPAEAEQICRELLQVGPAMTSYIDEKGDRIYHRERGTEEASAPAGQSKPDQPFSDDTEAADD